MKKVAKKKVAFRRRSSLAEAFGSNFGGTPPEGFVMMAGFILITADNKRRGSGKIAGKKPKVRQG